MGNVKFKLAHDMSKTMAGEKKTKIMFAVLIVAVLVLASVLGLIWYNNWSVSKQTAVYQAGYQRGAAAAILEIIKRSDGCKTVPLFADNVTHTYVDVSCLQKAAV